MISLPYPGLSGPADQVAFSELVTSHLLGPKVSGPVTTSNQIRNPLGKICACAVPTYQTGADAPKSQSPHENLLICTHGNNANRKRPKIHQRGVLETGGVTADKAAAALRGSGTWPYPLPLNTFGQKFQRRRSYRWPSLQPQMPVPISELMKPRWV